MKWKVEADTRSWTFGISIFNGETIFTISFLCFLLCFYKEYKGVNE